MQVDRKMRAEIINVDAFLFQHSSEAGDFRLAYLKKVDEKLISKSIRFSLS